MKSIRKFALLGAALGLGLALSGCGSLFGEDLSNDPNYQTGYSAGCGTGTGYVAGDPSTVIRDPDMWRTSKPYRSGWKAGFNACRTRTTNAPGTNGDYDHGRRNGPSGY